MSVASPQSVKTSSSKRSLFTSRKSSATNVLQNNSFTSHTSPATNSSQDGRDDILGRDIELQSTADERDDFDNRSVYSKLSFGLFDADVSNMDIVYEKHGKKPREIMKLRVFNSVPAISSDTDVIVKVEASTVSPMDCEIRRGEYRFRVGDNTVPPIVPGSDCVGKVLKCGKKAKALGIKEGDRVASLLVCGGNARFVILQPKDLIKVPRNVDAAEAVSLVTTYMAAFQALNDGKSNVAERYQNKPLQGKRVLVYGGSLVLDCALIELSRILGASRVYCPSYRGNRPLIRSLGANALSYLPEFWLPKVEGKIDLAIDGTCIDGYDATRECLKKNGKLVCIGMSFLRQDKEGFMSSIEELWTRMTIGFMSNTAYSRGVHDRWKSDPEYFQTDLEFLFKLLADGKIHPKIAYRIPLKKVIKAHEQLENDYADTLMKGQIVCKPWM